MTDPTQANEAIKAYMQAWQRFAEHLRTNVIPNVARALKPLAEFAESPQGQAFIAAAKAREEGRVKQLGCHCLCGANHRNEMGVCRSEQDVTVKLRVRSGDTIDAPMCNPCATRYPHRTLEVQPW